MARLFRRATLVLSILTVFARVEASLRRESLVATCARLGVRLDGPSLPPRDGISWRATRYVRAVERLSPLWPLGDTCLRRSLVIGYLLREDGAIVRLGVRRAGDGSIAAHSWVEVAGQTLDPMSVTYDQLSFG